MEKFVQFVKGIFGFGTKATNLGSVEKMIQSGQFVELTDEEMQSIVAPGSVQGQEMVEELKIERSLLEVLSRKTDRKQGMNKLFHSAIVKLSDGQVINAQNVSGDTAVAIGYHPAGYSIWNEEVVALEDGTYSVSWNSFNTCD